MDDKWMLSADPSFVGIGSTGPVIGSVKSDVPNALVSLRWTGTAAELRALDPDQRPLVNGKNVVHARLKVGGYFVVAGSRFDITGEGEVTSAIGGHRPSGRRMDGERSEGQPEPPRAGTRGRWQLSTNDRLTIGREGGPAEIALSGVDLAQRHATVSWTGRAMEVRSLTAQARPFVNGQPVLHARVPVGGQFMVGNHTLVISGPGELLLVPVQVDANGPLLRFDNVSLRYKKSREATLKNLSFELARGEVLAIIGPSGAGKSTMCGGLLGEISVESGTMMLGQADLSASRAQASHLVSFVPQDPAMFFNLSVKESLTWVAKLRLASDIDPAARNARIEKVIAAMGLTNDTEKLIASLSGGQKKRVSTAMELLSDPLLLVLDEPTSGLDEGLDRAMMDLLRSAASDEGRAVIVVTHSMVNIDRADKVLALTRRGQLSYFGPPGDLLKTFGAKNYAEVMDQLREDRITDVRPRVTSVQPPANVGSPAPLNRGSLARHLPRLVGREFARQRNSARQLATSLAIGIALTALLSAAVSPDGLAPNPKGIASTLIIFIVLLTFFSLAQSFSSIVDDRSVIERESRWSISATSMVLSRMITCVPLALALGVASTLLYLVLKSSTKPVNPVLPHPFGLFLFAILLPLAAMTMGLFISAMSKSLRQAVFILMGVLALQVVMTGLFPQFVGGAGKVMRVLAYLTPSRWTSAGLGANYGISSKVYLDPQTHEPLTAGALVPAGSQPQDSPFTDEIWTQDSAHVYTAAAALAVFGVIAIIGTCLLLRNALRKTK
jgi:ABC-type multidrug transport system ATPase subunit